MSISNTINPKPIYGALNELHKKYADQPVYYLPEMLREMRLIEEKYCTEEPLRKFYASMCQVLVKWFLDGFPALPQDGIPSIYNKLWKFHKKWLGIEKTDDVWGEIIVDAGNQFKEDSKYVQKYAARVMDSLED